MPTVVDLGYLPPYTFTSKQIAIITSDGKVTFHARVQGANPAGCNVGFYLKIDGQVKSVPTLYGSFNPSTGDASFDMDFLPYLSAYGAYSLNGTEIHIVTWDTKGFSITSVASLVNSTITYQAPLPQHVLTISSTIGGTTNPAIGTYIYDEGTVVNLAAFPDVGYFFQKWVINGAEFPNSTVTILIDKDVNAQAVFNVTPPQNNTSIIVVGATIAVGLAISFYFLLR